MSQNRQTERKQVEAVVPLKDELLHQLVLTVRSRGQWSVRGFPSYMMIVMTVMNQSGLYIDAIYHC